eukprot:m.264485 g.264485  ORF g.264485 m.264485 type:complete len:1303 (-) comp27854_c0_seq1:245-4153(-)
MPLFGGKKHKRGAPIRQPRKPLKEIDLSACLSVMNAPAGTAFQRVVNQRQKSYFLYFNSATLQLSWGVGKNSSNFVGTLNVEEIKEVRTGEQAKACKDFKSLAQQTWAKLESNRCLAIVYGSEFKVKTMCLYGANQEEVLRWTDGLWAHTRAANVETDFFSTDKIITRWLERHWSPLKNAKQERRESMTLKEVKLWMKDINLKLKNPEIKDFFSQVDKIKMQIIGFHEFTELYHLLLDIPTLADHFSKYCSKPSLGLEDVHKFFKDVQGEELSEAQAKTILTRFGNGPHITPALFIEYLHSQENSVWNPACDKVHMDMTQPLAHYFIASSHNTYLMGDQFKSESSVEAYINCLRDGCRCLEIDCWDGPNNEPIVFHGRTLTTKIKFADILPAIREHAWVASEYPIILSIENHCSLPQQKRMAEYFVEIFGDELVVQPPPECRKDEVTRDCYPSPEQLKRKIIIKHKKLEGNTNEVVLSSKLDDDISSSRRNGYLHMQDNLDGSWARHYFVLKDEKLFIAEAPEDESDKPEDEEKPAEEEEPQAKREEEMHFGEPWFHGALKRGRTAAEQLLKDYNGPEGSFLVRESESSPGEYSLSFWRNGMANHSRIYHQGGKYYMTNQISFHNLYELIEYYRREPMKSVQFSLTLGEAVPQPPKHLDRPWYRPDVSRTDAEAKLKRMRQDGVFLVRPSDTSQVGGEAFAISFRAEGKIKHCRINKEGRIYCIGDTEFEDMVELVEHYTNTPLYRKMKLKYPLTEELLKKEGGDEEEDNYVSEELYSMPNPSATNKTSVSCKAMYAYRGTKPDELTFPKDAIITNVIKQDVGWWQGDYGGKIAGWLPSNYVEEIDHEQLVKEDKEEKDNPLGELQKLVMDVAGMKVDPLPPTPERALVFQITSGKTRINVFAETEADMRGWAKDITDAAKTLKKESKEIAGLQRRMKVHKHLSDLVYYSRSRPFKSFEDSKQVPYYVMSSFNERRANENSSERRGQPKEFNEYNCRQLSRVYPNGKRVDSSNYDPQQLWNVGCQLVALNYQTPDKPMWINSGKFRLNGGCGYVLKPEVQRTVDKDRSCSFNPYAFETYSKKCESLTLKLTILSARHLLKPGRGSASPFVEIEVIGVPNDAQKYKTQTASHGFNPTWMETVTFQVDMPELATLLFTVQDEDVFGDASVIGQCALPLGNQQYGTLRQGYRSVMLKNLYNEPMDLCSILIHVESMFGGNEDEEYQSLQQLRAQMRKQAEERDALIKEKVLKNTKMEKDDQLDEHLNKINQELHDIEQKILDNPVEQRRAAQQSKINTIGKKGKK